MNPVKIEPDFMQKCENCSRVIWFFDKRNPNSCKKCFQTPKQIVTVPVVITYNFTNTVPVPYVWQED